MFNKTSTSILFSNGSVRVTRNSVRSRRSSVLFCLLHLRFHLCLRNGRCYEFMDEVLCIRIKSSLKLNMISGDNFQIPNTSVKFMCTNI